MCVLIVVDDKDGAYIQASSKPLTMVRSRYSFQQHLMLIVQVSNNLIKCC